MITRKLNERITFFSRKVKQNDEGDPFNDDKDLFSCWSEVAKATTKEFRDRSNEKIESLQKRRRKRTFYIRFRKDVSSEQFVKWRKKDYKIIDIEEDWRSKDILMITVEVVE